MATDIRDKIRALLAKAAATEHKGEADLFFAKAQELMEDHQVSLFELHVEDPIGITEGVEAQAGPPKYKSDVQVALAQYYGARPIYTGTSKFWRVRIVGPESSRLTTELMTDYVWAQVCKGGAELAKQGLYNRQQAIRHIAKALVVRIWREINQRKAQPVREGSAYSLTVVDAVDTYMQKNFPDLLPGKEITIKNLKQSAWEAAQKISLNHQVNTGRKTLRLE